MYVYDKTIDWRYEYFDYISKCRKNPPLPTEYSEKHHIISRCLAFDENDLKYIDHPTNLISLRFSEHVTAHVLLSFMIRQFFKLGEITKQQFNRVISLYYTPAFMVNVASGQKKRNERRLSEITDDILSVCEELKQERHKIKLDNIEELKKLVLDGKDRPKKDTYLGRMLAHYTNKGFAGNYQETLKTELVKLGAKSWFFDSREEENINKILDIAERQEPRPACTTYIGMVLHGYTNPKNKCYRPGLKEELLKILSIEMGEQWFMDIRGSNNMDTLRAMVKNGEKRPVCRIMGEYDKDEVYLGRALHLYTTPGNECYRPGFREELISLGGIEWFPDERVEENKRKLLEMAKNGEKRPNGHKDKIGRLLCNYTTVGSFSYQEGFKEELIKIRPDWFNDERAENNMNLLRKMAKNGEKRPTQKTPLGKYLSLYLDPTSASFREGFREELIDILGDNASSWFRNT